MLYTGEEGKMKLSQKKVVFDAYENAKQMSDLVNDLLNVTSIDSGKLEITPEPIDVVSVAETSISAMGGIMKEKGISVVLVKPSEKVPKLNLDKWLITRAIDNLLSNAVKYTTKGGKVTVKVEKKEGELVVSVADTGIGIPSSLQKNVFKKFFRARQAMAVSPEGTGLGLYIAKFAVSKFGGKIWFESEEGKGSTFFFTIPLKGQSLKRVRKATAPEVKG
jgi:signal transduction histidine kinase